MLSCRKRGETYYVRGTVRLGYRQIKISERAIDASGEADAERIRTRMEAVCTDGMLRDDGINLISYRVSRIKGVRSDSRVEPRVYAIWAEVSDLVKFGFSEDVGRRFSKLRAAGPDVLHLLMDIPGGEDLEREIHFRLQEHRVRGEWFRLDEPVLDLVARLANVSPMPDGIADRLRARMSSESTAGSDPD